MKKYLLLTTMFCATLLLGIFAYSSAHKNTLSDSFAKDKTEVFQRAELSQSVEVEQNSSKESFSEVLKEIGEDAAQSVAKFLFSLIYK